MANGAACVACRGARRGLLVWLTLCLAMATALFAGAPARAFAAEGDGSSANPTPPAASKTLTDNNDGTYSLNLSVTGSSSTSTSKTKANVVVVMDVSGSMNFHVESDTGSMGTRDASHPWSINGSDNMFQLYRRNGSRFVAISDGDNYSGTVYYREGFVYLQYIGLRYATQTRLDVAKSATTSLVNTLAANNTSAADDTIEITFETFSDYANTSASSYGKWYAGNDMSGLTTAINNLTATGGTNWDDGLHDATSVAQEKNDGDPTYYIFVSDGDPTYYMNQDHTVQRGNGNATTSAELSAAYAEADIIKNAGYHFYGVGVFGNVENMQSLAVAHAGGSYYSATDEDTLNAAFASIIDSITNSANFKDVKITDGITANTASTVLQDGASASDYTYTITAPDGTLHTIALNSDGTIATVDGGTTAVTLTDSVNHSLTLAPGQIFPGASATDGTITWDLSTLGQLLNGYTYTVSFRVWPRQVAYDTVAALHNGTISWDNVDQTQFQRSQNEDGTYSYSLRTNTSAKVDYTAVESVTNNGETSTTETTGSSTLDDVPAMPLVNHTMSVTKAWVGDAPSDDVSVTFELYIDNAASGKTVTLNKANNWSGEVAIAPGLIAGDETLETGHDYTLVETTGSDYHYEFASETVHPMLVNSATAIQDSKGGDTVLTGTNTRKSSLNISKTVVDNSADASADADQLFTYTVTVTDKMGSDVWFSIGNGSDAVVADGGRVSGAIAEEGTDGEPTGYYHAPSGTPITVKIKAGENIYFINLPVGSTYSITEENIPGGFTNSAITNNGGDATNASPTATGVIAAGNSAYAVGYTNTYNAVSVTPQVTKSVTGRDATEQFAFSLTPDADTQAAIGAGSVKVGTTTASTSTDGYIKKDGTEVVSFGSYTFYKEGAYTFTVEETTTTNAGGWAYDGSTHDIVVNISKGSDGKLVASVTGNNPVFTNSYSVKPATVDTDAEGSAFLTKAYSVADGLAPAGKTFEFSIAEVDAQGNAVEGGYSATGSAAYAAGDTSEAVDLGTITYTEPGTHYYKVAETTDDGGGWTKSGDGYTVTVTVTDQGDGTLRAAVSGTGTITNTYKPNGTEVDTDDATTGVFLTKAYSVADGLAPAGKTFEFSIAEVDAQGNAVEGGYSATGSAAYAAGDTSEAVDLGTITYTEPGTHYYKVAETTDDGGGWTKSGDGYTVTVTVTDQGDGTLRAAVSGTGTITNTYKPSEATAYIPVEKIMSVPEGLSAADLTGKFTFTLTADEGTPMPETTSYTNPDANGGTVTFGSIAYTQPGTYNYTVTESGSADGVTNDPKAAKTVTVDVKDNGDGTLSATSSSTTDAPLTFTNTLVPAKLDEETNTAVKVTKTLYGRDSKPGETFTFTMSPADSATVDAVKTGAIKLENDTATVSNAKDGQPADAAFGSMTFAQVGTYTFNVSEDKGTEAGMSYDADVKTLTVTVTDQGGKLVAVPEGDLSFTNTYTASGSYTPQGTKQLLGNPTEPATDEDNATPEEPATNNEQKQNETADVQNTEKSAASNAESDAVSPKEDAAEPAEAEKADESAAVEEQPASSDTATTESADATAAEDTAQTTADINPVAALLAPTQANAAEPEVVTTTGSFAFFVTYANGNAGSGLAGSEASRGTATVEYGKIANIAFNSISYKTGRADEAGTLEYLVANGAATKNADGSYDITYLVKENKTSDPFQLNTQTFTFTVHVVDNGNGTLAASLAEGSSAIAFVNHYLTADVTVSMSGLKVMNGTRSIEAGDYSFTIKGSDGAPMPAEATVKNAAGGSVDFGTITFTKDDLGSATEKTFTYTITEDEGDKPGVSYSDEAQTVTVTVKDNGNGTLSATTNPATTPLFTITNTYTPTPNQSSVTDQIKITKELTGRDLTAGEFTFQLKDASGNVVSEATNAADGTITFAPVSFTAAGDYTYQISELDNGVAGVTYDAISSYSVTAHVVDHFDGKPLEVTWTYGGGSQITFKNSYSSDPGTSSVTDFVKITKELTGRDLTAGEFTFQLKDADGNVVSTATNAADGTIIFNPITFTEVGTYTYTVSEVNSGADNITYDDSVYTVTATVTDNGDGTKSVVWSYEGGSIVFKNTYTAPAAPEPAKPAEAKPVKTPDTSDTNAGSMAFGAITVAGIVALGVGIALKRREH